MRLHLNKEIFKQFINKINSEIKIDFDILEKDYYVCCVLKELAKNQDYTKAYFKGGTAVYKILDTMNRFSEDIDLTVKVVKEQSKTQNNKRLKDSALKYNVEGLKLNKELCSDNKGSITSIYEYKSVFETTEPLQRAGKIQVESTSFTVSEPIQKYTIEPIIYKYASEKEKEILREEFEVQPIELNIIKLERIFVDKLFAAEFYYIRNMYTDTAKHVYDINILFNNKKIKELLLNQEELFKLISYKRKEELQRKGGIEEKIKLEDFSYLKGEFDKKFIQAFNNMQEKYIINDIYKLDIKKVIHTLNNIKGVLKDYRL